MYKSLEEDVQGFSIFSAAFARLECPYPGWYETYIVNTEGLEVRARPGSRVCPARDKTRSRGPVQVKHRVLVL